MRYIAQLVGLFLGVGLAFAGPVRAQDLSMFGQDTSLFGQMPPTFERCERERQERQLLIRAIREESSQCLHSSSSSRQAFIPECDYAWPRDCASLERQWCVLTTKNTAQGQLCRDRAVDFQRQEAERERLDSDRQRIDEAAAREQDRALRMVATAAGRGDIGLAMSIARRGVVDPNDPTRAPRLLASGGRQLADAMGVPTTRAMRLSGALSTSALNSFAQLGERALGDLNAASESGAFDVEGGSTGSSGPSQLSSTVSSSDTTAALQNEVQAYADLWNNGGDIGRVIAVAAIGARIAAILQDLPTSNADMARVSLVSGSFARSINSLTEAATRGEISLTDGKSPYAMVSQMAALSAQPEAPDPSLVPPLLPNLQVSSEARAVRRALVDQFEREARDRENRRWLENYAAAKAREAAARQARINERRRTWDLGGFLGGVLDGLASGSLSLPPPGGSSQTACNPRVSQTCEVGRSERAN